MCSFMLNRTTSRLNKSIAAVRYSQASSVAMRVMSLVHTLFGAGGAKSRSSKFGVIGSLCLLSVVATNLLLPRALMPWCCIIFLTQPNPFAQCLNRHTKGLAGHGHRLPVLDQPHRLKLELQRLLTTGLPVFSLAHFVLSMA